MKSIEVQLNEALDTINRQEKENAELKTVLHNLHVEGANKQRDVWLKESGLPQAICDRIRKAFPGTDLGGLRQAIKIEKRANNIQESR